MKFKILTLLILTLSLVSCDTFEITSIKLIEARNTPTHDLCSEQCAVLLDGNSCYNTVDGTATIFIPVPKGNTLTKSSYSNNKIYFESNSSGSVQAGYDVYEVSLKGLKKSPGAKLTVYLEIKSTMVCTSGNPSKLTDKKKGSVIAGVPLTQPSCEVECVEYP